MDEVLRDVYLLFARAVIAAAKDRVRNGTTLHFDREIMRFNEADVVSTTEKAANWGQVIPSQFDSDFPRKLGERCARTYFEKGIFRNVELSRADGTRVEHPSFKEILPYILSELMFPIRHVLKSKNNLHVTDKTIIATLREYYLGWSGEVSSFNYIVPLSNFDSDVRRIRLRFGFSICEFDRNRKNNIWPHLSNLFETPSIFQYMDSKYLIVCDIRCTKRQALSEKENHQFLLCILTALRLVGGCHLSTLRKITTPRLTHMIGVGRQQLCLGM